MKKIYSKLFLLYGLTFGFLMSLWHYINEGEIDFTELIFMIVFFGGIMSWFNIRSWKNLKLKSGGTSLAEEDFKLTQSEFLSKKISNQDIYMLLTNSKMTKKWKIKITNSQILGKTRNSWGSRGEKITISNVENEIKIESKPILRTTLFDNGRNKKNVLLIKELIEKQ